MENTDNKDLSFKDIIKGIKNAYNYILSRYVFLIVSGLIGAIFGVIFFSISKVQYTATASFALEEDKAGGASSISGLASQFGFDLGGGAGGAFAGTNILELMKSRSIVEKALLSQVMVGQKKTTLADFYVEIYQLNESWSKNSLFKSFSFSSLKERKSFLVHHDSLLGLIQSNIIKKNLIVSQKDKKVGIYYVSVKSVNEFFSKLFVETIVKEVSDFYINTKSKKARINVSILEHQADSIRKELNEAITGVASANDNTFNLNPALNIKRTPSTRKQVDVQANSAILTQLLINLELAKVSLRKDTPLFQIIDMPIFPLEKESLGLTKAIVVGIFLAGVLSIMFLLIKLWWRRVLN